MIGKSTRGIDHLLDRVSQKLSIAEFTAEISDFWEREIAERNLLPQIRLKRGSCKKFMDEVMPVFRFIKRESIDTGAVRFPLDNKIPDCFLWLGDAEEPRQVEVTIAQGKARHHLMKELIEKGSGRGFVDLQDDANTCEFERVISSERACYTTEQALTSTKRAIILSLEKKNDSKYDSMCLLIQGPLNVATLPYERWGAIRDDLVEAAKSLPFREIHVVGDDTEQPIGFRIK